MLELRVLKGDRPSVSMQDDGIVSFRPSEIGKCVRALAACYLGYEAEEPTEDELRVMHQGEIHEKHIAHDLELEYGGKVQRQVRVTCPLGDWATLDGTCDGVWFADPSEIDPHKFLVKNLGPWHDPEIVQYFERYNEGKVKSEPTVFLFEAKASDDNMFFQMRRDGPIEDYAWQISCYWAMVEYTLGVKLSGIFFCVGRRRNGERSFALIEEPPHTLEEIVARAEAVLAAASKGIECEDSVDCDNKSHFCRYWKFHKENLDHANHSAAKLKTHRFEPDLLEVAISLHQAQEEQAEIEGRIDGLKEQIQAGMHRQDRVSTPGFRFCMSSRDGVNYSDLMRCEPEIVKEFTKPTFDIKGALEKYPHLKEKYPKPGNPYLVARKVDSELKPILNAIAKENKPKKAKKSTIMASSQTEKGRSGILDMMDLENMG